MYDLHEYVKVLKLQKEKLYQKTITLLASNWKGVIDDAQILAAQEELQNQGIIINKFEHVDVIPPTGEVGVGYIVNAVCYMYDSTWSVIYEFDDDAPYTQTVVVEGVTQTNIVFAAPEPNINNMEIVSRCKIIATGQDTNLITFTAFDSRPSRNEDDEENEDIIINLVIGGEGK